MSSVHLHLLSSIRLIQITPRVYAVADLSGLRYRSWNSNFKNKVAASAVRSCRKVPPVCVVCWSGLPLYLACGLLVNVANLHETLYHNIVVIKINLILYIYMCTWCFFAWWIGVLLILSLADLFFVDNCCGLVGLELRDASPPSHCEHGHRPCLP